MLNYVVFKLNSVLVIFDHWDQMEVCR